MTDEAKIDLSDEDIHIEAVRAACAQHGFENVSVKVMPQALAVASSLGFGRQVGAAIECDEGFDWFGDMFPDFIMRLCAIMTKQLIERCSLTETTA